MELQPHLPTTSGETIIEDDRSRRSSLETPPRKQARQDFHCQLCDKRYQNSRSLKRHEREDRDHLRLIGRELENIYQCHVTDCGRSFVREWDLRRHVRETHGKQRRKALRSVQVTAEPLNHTSTCPELPIGDNAAAATVSSLSVSSDQATVWRTESAHAQVPCSLAPHGTSDRELSKLPRYIWFTESLNPRSSQSGEAIENGTSGLALVDGVHARSTPNNKWHMPVPEPALRPRSHFGEAIEDGTSILALANEFQAPSAQDQGLYERHISVPQPALRLWTRGSSLLGSRGSTNTEPDQMSNGTSTHDHIRLSMSCDPETHRVETRLDDDNASISTVSSMFSVLSLGLPFRSGLSGHDAKRNPRPQQLTSPRPCPICGKEFGVVMSDGIEVKDHSDVHLPTMQDRELMVSCMICQVSFVHVKDLEWHLNWSEQKGNCGFPHINMGHCTGHHPPSDQPQLQQNHASFSQQLRSWEAAQLRDFMIYVNEYARGGVRTNAPRYGVSLPSWSQSTGSLSDVRSLISTRSTPLWIDYHSRSGFATFDFLKPQKRSLPKRSSNYPESFGSEDFQGYQDLMASVCKGDVSGLMALVHKVDVLGIQMMLDRIPGKASTTDVQRLVQGAADSKHTELLQLLTGFRDSDAVSASAPSAWYTSHPLQQDLMASILEGNVSGLMALVHKDDVFGIQLMLDRIPGTLSVKNIQRLIKSAIDSERPDVLQLLVDFKNRDAVQSADTACYLEDFLIDFKDVWEPRPPFVPRNPKRYAHCLAVLLNGNVHPRKPNGSSWEFLGYISAVNISNDVLPHVVKINSPAVQSLACVASHCGFALLLEDLLLAGVDANSSITEEPSWLPSETRSALYYAMAAGRSECAALLLQHNALSDHSSRVNLIKQALQHQSCRLLEALLAVDPDLETDALAWCIVPMRRRDALRFLLRHRPLCHRARIEGHSSVEFAVRSSDTFSVKLLTDHGADFWSINEKGESPAAIALHADDHAMVDLLSKRITKRNRQLGIKN